MSAASDADESERPVPVLPMERDVEDSDEEWAMQLCVGSRAKRDADSSDDEWLREITKAPRTYGNVGSGASSSGSVYGPGPQPIHIVASTSIASLAAPTPIAASTSLASPAAPTPAAASTSISIASPAAPMVCERPVVAYVPALYAGAVATAMAALKMGPRTVAVVTPFFVMEAEWLTKALDVMIRIAACWAREHSIWTSIETVAASSMAHIDAWRYYNEVIWEFKIGIAVHPGLRYFDPEIGYKKWHCCHVLWISTSRNVGDLERVLVKHYLGSFGCANLTGGGGGLSPTFPGPCGCYVVFRPAVLWNAVAEKWVINTRKL